MVSIHYLFSITLDIHFDNHFSLFFVFSFLFFYTILFLSAEVTSQSSCPNGWESVPVLEFKGLQPGPCGCPLNAQYDGKDYFSSATSCISNQTLAGCIQDPGVDSLTLDMYLGRRTCFKRGGEAAVKSWYPWERRAIPEETNGCSNGYKRCGSGTYSSNKAICWPENLKCPITSLIANGTSSNINAVTQAMQLKNFTRNVSQSYNNDQWLFQGREQLHHLPVIDFKIAFTTTQDETVKRSLLLGLPKPRKV